MRVDVKKQQWKYKTKWPNKDDKNILLIKEKALTMRRTMNIIRISSMTIFFSRKCLEKEFGNGERKTLVSTYVASFNDKEKRRRWK